MTASFDAAAEPAIQAAERLASLGVLTPWSITPPLPPVLIAAISAFGVSAETAYLVVVALAWAWSVVAIYGLARRILPGLAVALAVLAAAAPARWIALTERGAPDGPLFWLFVLLLLWTADAFRRRPSWLLIAANLAALAAAVLSRSAQLTSFDGLAVLELTVLGIVGLVGRRDFVPVAAACAIFVAVGAVIWPTPSGPSESLRAWVSEQDPRAVVGHFSLDRRLNPIVREAEELIASPLRPRESLLWLRALATRYVIAPRAGKFAGQLECVREEAGWCVFELPQGSSGAVLVSRRRFAELSRIRGVLDIEGLESYLTWAARPEAVGVERSGPAEIRVRVDAAPTDLILLRKSADPAWSAEMQRDGGLWTAAFRTRDPLGFIVLDPGAGGSVEFRLHYQPTLSARLTPRLEEPDLLAGDFPAIRPEGIVDALSFEPPPLAPGGHITVFGESFRPAESNVRLDDRDVKASWAGTTQLNFQLPADVAPGHYALRVIADGKASHPQSIEVAP